MEPPSDSSSRSPGLIEPVLKDEALVSEILRFREVRTGFRLWWLGQSGFLLQWNGHHALIDPYLSDSLTQKYAGTEKPHVRMTQLVVPPHMLGFVELLTSSHNHTDHLDAATILPIRERSPGLTIVVPEANREFAARRLGIPPGALVGAEAGQTLRVGPFSLVGIPSAHDQVDEDAAGRCHYLGYVIRFGAFSVYHSGDTRLHDGLVPRLRPCSVDVAILPINGADPNRGVAGNLDGREAAELAHAIGARCAIPCHYEQFEFNTASPELFIRTAAVLNQPIRVLKAGERYDHA